VTLPNENTPEIGKRKQNKACGFPEENTSEIGKVK